jgi:hypothetical protein
MGEPSVVSLERSRVREVTGVFQSREALVDAADELLLAGFDRADIDVVGSIDEIRRRLGVYVAPEAVADVPLAPRRPFLKPEDFTITVGVIAAVLGGVAAMLTAFVALADGAGTGSVLLIAFVAGAVVAGIAAVATARMLQKNEYEGTASLMSERGLVLWVRVRSSEREQRALEILRAHGAEHVHVHEMEIVKTLDELPLSSLRPDPWLSGQPLGHR